MLATRSEIVQNSSGSRAPDSVAPAVSSLTDRSPLEASNHEVHWIMMAQLSTDYTLLIADDNSSFRQTVREVLERRFHFAICEVSCGEEAVDCVQECQIDIVLLDMHMHHMTGLDTIRVLKDMDALRPCILITSDDSDDLRRDATQADAHTVLHKPVRRNELVTTVSRALHDAYDTPLSDDLLI